MTSYEFKDVSAIDNEGEIIIWQFYKMDGTYGSIESLDKLEFVVEAKNVGKTFMIVIDQNIATALLLRLREDPTTDNMSYKDYMAIYLSDEQKKSKKYFFTIYLALDSALLKDFKSADSDINKEVIVDLDIGMDVISIEDFSYYCDPILGENEFEFC